MPGTGCLPAPASLAASQRPPAKPEACRRCSGSKPHGPSGGSSTPVMLPTPRVFARPLPSAMPPAATRHPEAPSVCTSSGASHSLCASFIIDKYRHRFHEIFPELSNSGTLPGKAGGLPSELRNPPLNTVMVIDDEAHSLTSSNERLVELLFILYSSDV